jgi:hypothetical protein
MSSDFSLCSVGWPKLKPRRLMVRQRSPQELCYWTGLNLRRKRRPFQKGLAGGWVGVYTSCGGTRNARLPAPAAAKSGKISAAPFPFKIWPYEEVQCPIF